MANTNKDHAKLKEVSACFTEKTLKDILYTVHNGKEVNVLSWEFTGSSATGDNYLSTIYKIKVTGAVDGKKCKLIWWLKLYQKMKVEERHTEVQNFLAMKFYFIQR